MSGLTVNQVIEQLPRIAKQHGDNILVVGYDPGRITLGGSPYTPVTGLSIGFDWNHGKVFLQTEKKLGLAGDELEQLRNQINTAHESLYHVRRILDDKQLSDTQKFELIAETVVSTGKLVRKK